MVSHEKSRLLITRDDDQTNAMSFKSQWSIRNKQPIWAQAGHNVVFTCRLRKCDWLMSHIGVSWTFNPRNGNWFMGDWRIYNRIIIFSQLQHNERAQSRSGFKHVSGGNAVSIRASLLCRITQQSLSNCADILSALIGIGLPALTTHSAVNTNWPGRWLSWLYMNVIISWGERTDLHHPGVLVLVSHNATQFWKTDLKRTDWNNHH